MNFEVVLNSISKIENISLPGQASQFKMVPPFRQELLKKQQGSIKDAKQSAVLALLYPDSNYQTHIVLILRKAYKGVHSAQISFPGGRVEDTDSSLKETALRETHEEVGVPAKRVKIIKELTNVYIPPSNYFVQPYLGIMPSTPELIKEEKEVEEIIQVRMQDVFNEEYIITKRVSTSYKIDVEVPAFQLNGHVVWGATAMMLSEIKDILKASL
ncbi:MAG: CoA pyrophosphatase [Flavobacteriaceae bacterium]|nr:CoA pyrophosphatase [Flavobacteriaceae bacterium]NNK27902.1 CoA pyrophosphatase [Flavobacteriaceae bacterium]RZV63142.1 MAG: CoA pyrophosphatase [Flavobacteriaceae bacterium]